MDNIITCFASQTYSDVEVIFIVDKIVEKHWDPITLENGIKVKYITNLNANFTPHNNASYNRNFGIEVTQGEFIQLMDDDERFPPEYLQRSMDERYTYFDELGKDFVLTPTLMYRHTGHIQNQGFSYFNYYLSRPIPQKLGHKKRATIQMYSGNALLAPARIFKHIKFDEKIDFVYEDLDFTYRIHKAGYPLIVLRDLKIYHMERDKTRLEQARVGYPLQAYKKAKHRIVFVKKNGNLIQKIEFFLLWFRAQPLRLICKVLFFGKKSRRAIIREIIKGTRDGLRGN